MANITGNNPTRNATCESITLEGINYLEADSASDQATRLLRYCKVTEWFQCDLSHLIDDDDRPSVLPILPGGNHTIQPYEPEATRSIWATLHLLDTNANCNSVASILQSSYALCIGILSVIANLIVISTIARHRHLRTVTNCFLLSLAASDYMYAFCSLYTSVMSILMYAAQRSYDDRLLETLMKIKNDHFLCLFLECPGVLFASLMASLFSLMAIALEKYIGIFHPLHYYQLLTTRRATALIAAIWLVSMTFGLMPWMGWNRYAGVCYFVEKTSYEYLLTWGLVCSASAAITLVMYLQIFKMARKHACQIRQTGVYMANTSTSQSPQIDETDQTHEHPDTFNGGTSNGNHTDLYHTETKKNGRIFSIGRKADKSHKSPIKKVKESSKKVKPKWVKVFVGNKQQVTRSRLAVMRPQLRTIKTMAMLLAGFYLCWLPLLIYIMVYPYRYSNVTLYWLATLALTMSLLNPLIYGFRNKAVKKTLVCS